MSNVNNFSTDGSTLGVIISKFNAKGIFETNSYGMFENDSKGIFLNI